jgi:ribosomal protein S18 acetylase RimI-like enzyme
MPDVPFVIEQARPKHVRAIAALYKTVWSEVAHLLGPTLTQHRQASIRTIAQWIHDDPYFVALADKKVTGVAGAEPRHGTVHLVHMVVDSKFRKYGVGTALVKHIEEFARNINANKIWFDTHPELYDAIQLYEKLGYQKCGFFKQHYWGIDIVLYEKLL